MYIKRSDIWVQKIPPRQTKEQFDKFVYKDKPKKKYRKIDKVIIQKLTVDTPVLAMIKEKKKPKKKSIKSKSRKRARDIKKDVTYCEWCNRDDIPLEVHHKDCNPLNNNELNLVKLCCVCHYEVHKDDAVWKIMYKRIMDKGITI